MRRLIILSVIVLSVLGCEKSPQKSEVPVSSDADGLERETTNSIPSKETCYMEAMGQDSLFVQMNIENGNVKGKMHYKNYQKDSSSGEIQGIEVNDTIKVVYSFDSEGMRSNREIWFLKKQNQLVEGIGEYNESGENYIENTVVFEGGHILNESDCIHFD